MGRTLIYFSCNTIITNQTNLVKPVYCIPCPLAGSLSTVTLQKTMVGMLYRIKGAASKIGGSLTPLMPGDPLTSLEWRRKDSFSFFLRNFLGQKINGFWAYSV